MLGNLFKTDAKTPASSDAGQRSAPVDRQMPTISPVVDIYEDDQRVVVLADLPGVAQDAVEISVHRGVLTLRATPAMIDESSLRPLYREWRPAVFSRSFTLADDLDDQAVTAQVTNGVLRIELPRRASAQPRRIQVTAA
jgi:HSP20 family molecular chaperone IbpA